MKKITFLILSFVLLNSCVYKNENIKIIEDEQLGLEDVFICKKFIQKNQIFEICLKKYQSILLKSSSGEVLYQNDNNPSEYEFIDFNDDGELDIKIHYVTNVPNVTDLLLFNTDNNMFKEVKKISNFPDSSIIENTSYYYSYERNGCADNNWDSYLFQIKNFEIIKKGYIKGLLCEQNSDRGIYIYKTSNEKKEILTHLTDEVLKDQDKWSFINHYWTINHRLFK